MQMRQLVDTILARCQALKLQSSETGAVDASAVELMLLHVLQGLSDSYDFETLTMIGDPLFVTQAGQRTYALPDDFQRFLLPKDDQAHGLWLHNGTHDGGLRYDTPEGFRRSWSTTNGKPGTYTLLAGPTVRLDPPPDANGTTGYRGTGTYIRTITPDMLEGAAPLLFPSGLVEMTVAALAVDASHTASQLLVRQGEQARGRLLNAHARLAQTFQSRNGRLHHYSRLH